MATPFDQSSNLGEVFRKVLNRHGYGFHYRVMDEAGRLYDSQRSRWLFAVSEFPVTVRGRDARIDFILRHADRNMYLIAECKRVNSALSNWCFARAPYPNPYASKLIFPHAMIDGNANLRAGISENERSEQIYHISFEISSGETGDKEGNNRGALEKAAEQVLLGLNGMIEFMSNNKLLVNLQEKRLFVPVIFTTANLFTTEVDLRSATLERGEFMPGSIKLDARPWIWLQYHQSRTLKHSSPNFDHVHNVVDPTRRPTPNLGVVLETEYERSIAIVSPSGIESFLVRDW